MPIINLIDLSLPFLAHSFLFLTTFITIFRTGANDSFVRVGLFRAGADDSFVWLGLFLAGVNDSFVRFSEFGLLLRFFLKSYRSNCTHFDTVVFVFSRRFC